MKNLKAQLIGVNVISKITAPRVGGLALIIGSALYILSTLITAIIVVDGASASDLYAYVDAIADAPLLAGFAAMLGTVALMILLWGLSVMWQTAQSECALDTFVKFGLIGVILAVIFLMVAQSANYATSQVVEHGVGAGVGSDQTEFLKTTGIHLQSVAGVARTLASIAELIGYVVLGFALARKFRPGTYRILTFFVGIGAIVSLIGLLLTEPFHGLIDTLAPIFTALSLLYLVWWIIIGVGVYQERFGLRIGVTPEH